MLRFSCSCSCLPVFSSSLRLIPLSSCFPTGSSLALPYIRSVVSTLHTNWSFVLPLVCFSVFVSAHLFSSLRASAKMVLGALPGAVLLSHQSNYQDRPLFFSSLPFLCAHPCIASSQSGCRVCQRILDTRVVEAGP